MALQILKLILLFYWKKKNKQIMQSNIYKDFIKQNILKIIEFNLIINHNIIINSIKIFVSVLSRICETHYFINTKDI